jgi:hypothetical protein
MGQRLVEDVRNGQTTIVQESGRHTVGNPNYVGDGFHIEEHTTFRVEGRARLAPESTVALQREIAALGSPDIESPRPARSASMQARLANARRDVQRRLRAV